MTKHFNIKVIGKVQGIFFRAGAEEMARELGLAGFARNDPDGSVYIEAESEEDILNKFLEWCKKGPVGAKIDKVETKEGLLQNFSSFEIRY